MSTASAHPANPADPADPRLAPMSEPPVIRLRYSSVFLPEYLSTIAISIVISIPFLLVPIRGGVAIGRNPHAPGAMLMYGLLVVLLTHRTFVHRSRHRPIRVTHEPDVGVVVHAGTRAIHLSRLDEIEFRIDHFFGRRVRAIHVRDVLGNELVVHDGLDGFPEFLRLVTTVVDQPIRVDPGVPLVEAVVATAWVERHTIFPLTVEASVSRGVIRFFFLIPVAFVDFIANLWLNFQFVAQGRGELAVYAAPATLVLAALVNRYVSYYLLTSRRMNR